MNAVALVREFKAVGVAIEVRDGKLRVDAPKGVVTVEMREQLVRHKVEVIELLSAPAEPPPPWAGDPAEACNWSQTPLPPEWCDLADLPDDDEHAAWLRGEDCPPPGDRGTMAGDLEAVVRDLIVSGTPRWRVARMFGLAGGEAAAIADGASFAPASRYATPKAVAGPCAACGDTVSWRPVTAADWRCRTCTRPRAERRDIVWRITSRAVATRTAT